MMARKAMIWQTAKTAYHLKRYLDCLVGISAATTVHGISKNGENTGGKAVVAI